MGIDRMIKSRVLSLVAVACSLALASCAATPRRCPCPPPEPAIPGPAKVDIRANLTVDLPAEMSTELKMPLKLKGTLHVKVDAEALDDSPGRSRFLGTLSLAVTDLDGKHKYLVFKTRAEGEADGSPGEGVAEAFTRFGNAVMLLGEPLEALSPQAAEDEP